MKKYNCEYRNSVRLNIGDKWQMKIEAANPKEAYEKFIEKVGRYPEEIIVDIGWLDSEIFDDHVEAAKQRILEKEKAEGEQIESQKTKEVEQNKKLSTDELLAKIIQMQKQQSELFENQINNQNEQTESLNKIRWAIIALLIFIVGQTIVLKMKWGLWYE